MIFTEAHQFYGLRIMVLLNSSQECLLLLMKIESVILMLRAVCVCVCWWHTHSRTDPHRVAHKLTSHACGRTQSGNAIWDYPFRNYFQF